jgi:hypothetical protein
VICKHCGYNFETKETPDRAGSLTSQPAKGKSGKGCLIVLGVMAGLGVISAITNGGGSGSSPSYKVAAPAAADGANPAVSNLTGPQENAARTAKQYLNMTGFSRAGLIDQLSSSAGNGYDVADATVAVDSLNVDWNDQAVRSAKQYLSMTGFSCKGLIDQLSSGAGSKYTVSQATYGARQAGAC